MNKIYFLCGNARTFIDCFDSIYEHIINKLFDNNQPENTYILFYLKCDDPGPKLQKNGKWSFSYKNLEESVLTNEITKFKNKYQNITFYSKILLTNEIKDEDLIIQFKDRTKYVNFLNNDKNLLRALHYYYNIEQCGKIINNIEIDNNIIFDYYIYIRPDLLFISSCNNISYYSKTKITTKHDYISIIPKKRKKTFFFDRMNLIRKNKSIIFSKSEKIFFYTIKSIVSNIGKFNIKRS